MYQGPVSPSLRVNPTTQVVLADGSRLRIKDLIKQVQHTQTSVLTLQDGVIVPQPILEWKEHSPTRNWGSLRVRETGSRVTFHLDSSIPDQSVTFYKSVLADPIQRSLVVGLLLARGLSIICQSRATSGVYLRLHKDEQFNALLERLFILRRPRYEKSRNAYQCSEGRDFHRLWNWFYRPDGISLAPWVPDNYQLDAPAGAMWLLSSLAQTSTPNILNVKLWAKSGRLSTGPNIRRLIEVLRDFSGRGEVEFDLRTSSLKLDDDMFQSIVHKVDPYIPAPWRDTFGLPPTTNCLFPEVLNETYESQVLHFAHPHPLKENRPITGYQLRVGGANNYFVGSGQCSQSTFPILIAGF